MATALSISSNSSVLCRKLTEPMIHPQVWQDIPHSQISPAIGFANHGKCTESESEANVACEDELGIFSLVQWTCRIEVVDSSSKAVLLSFPTALLLAFMKIMSSNVERGIKDPAE